MIEAKEVQIKTVGGESKTFIISKFDAIVGREIITQYPASGIPKLGDYATNEALMLKIMCYVSVPMPEGPPLPLTNRTLVVNHVPEWETLARIEWAMMEYNCSFFTDGRLSSFFDDMLERLPASILSILTPLLEQLSPNATPPSGS